MIWVAREAPTIPEAPRSLHLTSPSAGLGLSVRSCGKRATPSPEAGNGQTVAVSVTSQYKQPY